MAELARAAPDGYTIAFASQGTLVFNQAIYANPGYDSIKDFAPVAFVGGVSNVMIVPPASTATRPADVIAEAKAKPGQLNFSSGGAARAITCPACCSVASREPISSTFPTRARRRACWR